MVTGSPFFISSELNISSCLQEISFPLSMYWRTWPDFATCPNEVNISFLNEFLIAPSRCAFLQTAFHPGGPKIGHFRRGQSYMMFCLSCWMCHWLIILTGKVIHAQSLRQLMLLFSYYNRYLHDETSKGNILSGLHFYSRVIL